ncbi:ParB N-terminal domain-containing protein [Bradyrhizobium sp. USDA 4451]
MQTKSFDYPALLVRQGSESPPLVLFSASAVDIEQWVGVPQKTRILDDGETMGFQRDDNPRRVEQIAQFYQDPHNVIHNPLLCAIRKEEGVEVSFVPTNQAELNNANCAGKLTITLTKRSEQPLVELFRDARLALEQRVPELSNVTLSNEKLASIRSRIDQSVPIEERDEEDERDDDPEEGGGSDTPEEALFDESHVAEFWQELKSREVLLGKLPDFDQQEFVGFSRQAVEALLRPIVLVDGQHRLLGALKAARDSIDEKSEPYLARVAALLQSGTPAADINHTMLDEKSRRLPISLLLDEKPGEHVFQFVIVNQKATPVRPALLGTIISTSLSEGELDPISERLEKAGVGLEEAKAATFFARNPNSPFAHLVSRGFDDSSSDLLPWTVLRTLINIFRNLSGAKFFHQGSGGPDYAKAWAHWCLAGSEIVDSDSEDVEKLRKAWAEGGGPWRDVFMAFWTAVRDNLGETENTEAPNYWGRPRTSNLFNKPMLMTLATDFFSFMNDTRRTIASADDVKAAVDEWLRDVKKQYFARDWKLAGVKKDSVGTRKQWAKIWYNYRRDPLRVPAVSAFSVLYKEG